MKTLFDPAALGHLELKNRTVRSATMESAQIVDGVITPELKKVYEDLAKGGVGLIITGMMSIGPDSRVGHEMVASEREDFCEKLRETAELVHHYGSKIVVQLSHCGVKTSVLDHKDSARGPSGFVDKAGNCAKAMTHEEIAQVAADFAAAAKKCQQAGVDGVQIHGAHAYLLSQFLSPYYNKRTDEYGGPIENRARIVLEVYRAVRQTVGEDYPVLIKINYSDLVEGGLTGEECIWVCKELEKLGVDAIEVSSGLSVDRASSTIPRMFNGEMNNFMEAGKAVAEAVNVAVLSVCGHRDPEKMEAYLNETKVTAISMCRPFMREPDIVGRWEAGDRSPAKCVSCNQCLKGLYACKLVEKE